MAAVAGDPTLRLNGAELFLEVIVHDDQAVIEAASRLRVFLGLGLDPALVLLERLVPRVRHEAPARVHEGRALQQRVLGPFGPQAGFRDALGYGKRRLRPDLGRDGLLQGLQGKVACGVQGLIVFSGVAQAYDEEMGVEFAHLGPMPRRRHIDLGRVGEEEEGRPLIIILLLLLSLDSLLPRINRQSMDT